MTSWFYMREKEFITGVIKKLPLLEQFVLSSGYFEKESIGALLEHCPNLQLLDVGGCVSMRAIGVRFVQRCKSRIRDLQMPQIDDGGCSCCVRYAQRYADEHDE